MLRALSFHPRGHWAGPAFDTIVLDRDARHRRRILLHTVHGVSFLLDLAETSVLHNGGALCLEDGRLIEVVAAPEALTEIVCPGTLELGKLAWHLGNRHLPVEIRGLRLRIRRDPVIRAMLAGFRVRLIEIEAPFEPETGAYTGMAQEHTHTSGGHKPHG